MATERPITNVKTEGLSIAIPSHELFLEAVESLPVLPEYGEITFTPRDVRLRLPDRDENKETYSSYCLERGIIPLRLRISYWGENSVGIREISPRSIMPLVVESFLMGGKRLHEIKVDMGEGDYAESRRASFENFRKRLLPSLLNQGYQIQEAELWITTGRSRGHGVYGSTILKFLMGGPESSGVRLQLGSNLSPEDSTKLENWFNNLREKYQQK